MSKAPETVVELDREGFLAALRILNRCLSNAEHALAGISDESIAARVALSEEKPPEQQPRFASTCRFAFYADWEQLLPADAFEKIAPYVTGVLAELERRGALRGPVSERPRS